ncbi:Ig-like domain-containing protein [Robertkochia aurantiaca]|uniref:Ig-like domain-containing protein n=1 Tax=Robertkochia aurantiaca TaxID=2873700 RepID=UPI001CC96D2D|nr:Ig-like domain-containing protein [Robertkochia sp. 3YJGBD-33]
MNYSRAIRILAALMLFIGVTNCAKRGNPTGGPKDETPPEIISARPENGSTNFQGDEFRINFDEFIKLQDLQKNLVVSPPLAYQPIIYPQSGAGKYLNVEIIDTLKENTTYVFNFGQAIVDNNEGNPYPFFTYVFSTGDYIDSLTLEGFVSDVQLKQPDPYISVMLWEMDSTYTDSVIYKNPPKYITNTLDSSVTFRLTNLKAGRYKMIALLDEANNYVFDPKTDKIGFVEEPITLPNDTLYEIELFMEETEFKALRPSLLKKNKIAFGYEGDPEKMAVNILSEVPDDFRSKTIKSIKSDSLYYFFTPFETDSLVFEVSREVPVDTFTVRIRDLYPDSLNISQYEQQKFGVNNPFQLHASIPVIKVEDSLIGLIDQDSTQLEFTYTLDSLKNLLIFNWNKEPSRKYNISLNPGAITDFFGNTNDSLSYLVSTKSLADLGSITVNIGNADQFPLILQLTDDKGEVKYEATIREENPSHSFRNISPGNYLIRVIHDTNGNGKWDTGSFLENRQPEKISYMAQPVELRPNWEIDQTFTLE